MKILKHDLKINRKSTIIWGISVCLMSFFMVSIYDSLIASNAEQWAEMMNTMPKAFLEIFEISDQTFTNMLSYYAMEGYLYVSLMLSIYAALLASKLINNEEVNKTTEFILSKPLSRIDYISQKISSLIISVVGLNIINTIILYIGMLIGTNESINMVDFSLYAIGTLLISLSFGVLTFMIATILKRNKGMSGITIGIVFASFFLGIISDLSDKLEFLKYFSLFKYANPTDLLEKGVSPLSLLVFSVIIIGGVIVSYLVYNKKDIYN